MFIIRFQINADFVQILQRPQSGSSRRSSCSSLTLDVEPTRDTEVGTTSTKRTPKKKRKKKLGSRSKEASDHDILSSPRTSETSRVSFDPVLSDAEETPNGMLSITPSVVSRDIWGVRSVRCWTTAGAF